MFTVSDLLSMDNEELYEVYKYGLEHKDLKLINTVRSVVADKFSLRALEHSPVDDWRNSKAIARFFQC